MRPPVAAETATSISTASNMVEIGNDYDDTIPYSIESAREQYNSVCLHVALEIANNIKGMKHNEGSAISEVDMLDESDNNSMGTIDGISESDAMDEEHELMYAIDESIFDPLPMSNGYVPVNNASTELYSSLVQLLTKTIVDESITIGMIADFCALMEMKKREHGVISQDCKAKSLTAQ